MAGDSKIKLFIFTQKVCQAIGIFSPESNQNRNHINLKNMFFLFLLAVCFTGTAGYLLLESNSMIEYGMSFFICTALVLSIVVYLILLWQNYLNFIENCELFIEKRTRSRVVYKETNEKIERFTELFAFALLVTDIIVMLCSLLYTIVNYYILMLGKDSFVLFCPMWCPFDWKTPFRYLLLWLVQLAGSLTVLTTAVPCFNIMFGSSWLFIVIAEDITNDVVSVNNTIKILKRRDQAELMEDFCDIVQNYSDAKQLIKNFNDEIKYSLLAFFSSDMVTISSLLVTFQFQLWDDNSKLVEIMSLSVVISWLFAFNLIICEPGERVTHQFEQFGMELKRCEWNNLSIEMQRLYLIFLSDTQQPKILEAYGGIQCTRETFKKITTKGFSYFMALRNFKE